MSDRGAYIKAMVAEMERQGVVFEDENGPPCQAALDRHAAGFGPAPWPDPFWTLWRLMEAADEATEVSA